MLLFEALKIRIFAMPENTHGLSKKIQGTYFKISALYFKIYALYFLPFQVSEKQCGIKGRFLPVFMPSKNHVVRRFCASRNEEMRAVTHVMNKGHGVLKSRSGGERKTSFP